MFSGVVDSPHSGQSTVSCEWDRASVISFDRSSWMVRSPRQGQPRCASAQRPGHVATGCLLGKRDVRLDATRVRQPFRAFCGTWRQVDGSTWRRVELPARPLDRVPCAPLACSSSRPEEVAGRAGGPGSAAIRPGPGVHRRGSAGMSPTRSGDVRDSMEGRPASPGDCSLPAAAAPVGGDGRPAERSCGVVSIRARLVRRVSRAGSRRSRRPAPVPDTRGRPAMRFMVIVKAQRGQREGRAAQPSRSSPRWVRTTRSW